jgi:hypothetical protein
MSVVAPSLVTANTHWKSVTSNLSIDTDPQQQAAPLMLVVRSFLR